MKQKLGNLDTHELITSVLALVSINKLNIIVSGLKLANTKLLENKTITKDDADIISEMIKSGIAENEKIHKLHPERT